MSSEPSIIDQLDLIADMTRVFGSDLSEGNQLPLRAGLKRVAEHVRAEAASLFLLESDGTELVCRACCGPVDITGLTLPADVGIVGRTVTENRSQKVRDVAADPDFGAQVDEETGFTTKSILCAPLSVRGECLGAIEVINKTDGSRLFNSNDMKLLEVLAGSVALAIVNTRLTAQAVEQERLARELELAEEIQRGLLPRLGEQDDPVHGVNLPAHTVSGDFFDYLHDSRGRLWFCVGDVSGKGMKAALMMAKTASLFRVLARTSASPGPLMDIINHELCETSARGMFVTMITGCVDEHGEVAVLANAGHEPPLLWTPEDNAFSAYPAGAPPLGILPEVAGPAGFPELSISLDQGFLYLFTDGVTEARTPNGALLGAERFTKLIAEGVARSARDQVARLVSELDARGMERRDDLTILIVDGAACKNKALRDASRGHESTGPDDAFHSFDVNDHSRTTLLCSVELPAQPNRLKMVRDMVRASFNGVQTNGGIALTELLSPQWTEELVLAIDEACQNIIRHAYGHSGRGSILLGLWILDDPQLPEPAIGVQLRDFAPHVDPCHIHPRDLDDIRPGGLGTHFMRVLTHHMRYRQAEPGPGTILEMIKYCAPPAKSDAVDAGGA